MSEMTAQAAAVLMVEMMHGEMVVMEMVVMEIVVPGVMKAAAEKRVKAAVVEITAEAAAERVRSAKRVRAASTTAAARASAHLGENYSEQARSDNGG
jgi:hypothetical protein